MTGRATTRPPKGLIVSSGMLVLATLAWSELNVLGRGQKTSQPHAYTLF
jgi:hypothetical protein